MRRVTWADLHFTVCSAECAGLLALVYKPESRTEGLHDSFSNLLSWLKVPSRPADDISTGTHHTDGVHTRTWTRTRFGLTTRSGMRPQSHQHKGATAPSAHTCCCLQRHRQLAWTDQSEQGDPSRGVRESHGDVYKTAETPNIKIHQSMQWRRKLSDLQT